MNKADYHQNEQIAQNLQLPWKNFIHNLQVKTMNGPPTISSRILSKKSLSVSVNGKKLHLLIYVNKNWPNWAVCIQVLSRHFPCCGRCRKFFELTSLLKQNLFVMPFEKKSIKNCMCSFSETVCRYTPFSTPVEGTLTILHLVIDCSIDEPLLTRFPKSL